MGRVPGKGHKKQPMHTVSALKMQKQSAQQTRKYKYLKLKKKLLKEEGGKGLEIITNEEKTKQTKEQVMIEEQTQADIQAAKQEKRKFREAQRKKHLQKTKRGQPVMKHRIESMLDKIKANS